MIETQSNAQTISLSTAHLLFKTEEVLPRGDNVAADDVVDAHLEQHTL